jgi:hypothetical protein
MRAEGKHRIARQAQDNAAITDVASQTVDQRPNPTCQHNARVDRPVVLARGLPSNAPGPFFVDSRRIDCGTGWGWDPLVFAPASSGATAHVRRQHTEDIYCCG